jgi:hypothetical protein
MGREYNGDIQGKFWFGVQSSNDATFFHIMGTDAEEYETVWDCCGSLCEEGDDKCPNCDGEEASEEKRDSESEVNYSFKNDEDQMKKLDEDLLMLALAVGFSQEDLERFRELAKKAADKGLSTPELKELCEAVAEDKELTDDMKELIDEIEEHSFKEHEYKRAKETLQARFLLGLRIEEVLKRQDTCTFWCEC